MGQGMDMACGGRLKNRGKKKRRGGQGSLQLTGEPGNGGFKELIQMSF